MVVRIPADKDPSAYIPAAILVNYFYINVKDSIVRIAFSEAQAGGPYRTAICMTVGDALELAQVLTQLLAPSPSSLESTTDDKSSNKTL